MQKDQTDAQIDQAKLKLEAMKVATSLNKPRG
jgi:hypothetical protein